MHSLGEPQLGAPVQIGEIDRDAVGFDLREEGLLELAERTLDLALALGIAGLTRGDLRAVMGREADRWRVQHE
ncbi:MAG: hypothetical protein KDB24_07725, partial [Microthrixaceae bacterium]|nr:hypothetical protein [Microthrixaceae bacterium]